nr:ABC transporter substrate-binding protein [Yoonia sp.]
MHFFTGFPIYVANELGFFEENGIDTEPRYFPSGAPIIQAAAANEWDITFLGAPPFVLAGPRLDLKTIGVVTDGSTFHQLIGRADFVEKVKADPSLLRGAKIFVTTNSTGHYVLDGCLEQFGLTQEDVTILPSEQTAIGAAFLAGEGDLAQVWPPLGDALQQKGDNAVLCDGVAAGRSVPDIWVVHPEFAAEHPEVVERWMVAVLQAVDWIHEDPERTYEMFKKFDDFRGYESSDDVLRAEVQTLLTSLLSGPQALEMLSSQGDEQSPVAASYQGIANFFKRVGVMTDVPEYGDLVDPTFVEKALAN